MAEGASKGNFVAISSDASNIEFGILRFIADRASIGEQTEALFALETNDEHGSFKRMYDAVQPRLVTEFTYRHSPHKDKALIYMALEQPEDDAVRAEEAGRVVCVRATAERGCVCV